MKYRQEDREPFRVVRVDELRLDALVSQEFKTELFKIVDEGVRHLGIDLANVTFVDSSGLGSLVAVLKKIGTGGSMRVWGLTPEVQSVFELTQLYKVFDVYETEEDALTV